MDDATRASRDRKFSAFDAAWSAEHHERPAHPGGVRETFWRAAFEAGIAEAVAIKRRSDADIVRRRREALGPDA